MFCIIYLFEYLVTWFIQDSPEYNIYCISVGRIYTEFALVWRVRNVNFKIFEFFDPRARHVK